MPEDVPTRMIFQMINCLTKLFYKKMQKVKIFMVAALIAVCATFTGCEEIPFVTPTIKVILNGTVQNSITVSADQEVVMDIEWQAGLGFNLKEVRLSVVDGSNVSGFPKTSGFTTKSLEKLEGHVVRSPSTSGGTVRFFTEVTTSGNGEPLNREIVITFTAAASPVNTYQNVQLSSAMDFSTNICFATSNGQRYGSSPATPGIIDFIYFNDLGAHTLSSPNHAAQPGVLQGVVGDWTTKNTTKLQRLTNVTAAQFDEVANDAQIAQHVSASITSQSVTNLAANNIVGFVTDDGKRGLIKVKSVNDPANHINITVKVQK